MKIIQKWAMKISAEDSAGEGDGQEKNAIFKQYTLK